MRRDSPAQIRDTKFGNPRAGGQEGFQPEVVCQFASYTALWKQELRAIAADAGMATGVLLQAVLLLALGWLPLEGKSALF